MTRILVATRNEAKLRELRAILAPVGGLELVSASGVFGPEDPEEAELEQFQTFAQNAAAKALYFARRCSLRVLADDSGLCVDALGGAPGVRSRRFAADHGLDGSDTANNVLLLRKLDGLPEEQRTAEYVCAVAVAEGNQLLGVRTDSCAGRILSEPRGQAGFGYDPLFWIPEERATFGEIPLERKNRISHRARAALAAAPLLSI